LVLAKTDAVAKAPAPVKVAAPAKAGTTLENLQKAYNGEMNAQAKYLAFAEKAKAEGYLKVAKLFRAIARSESMHAASHAKVITAMGHKPADQIVKAKVGTTAENLRAAINGETYEVDEMYPAFIKQAEADKNSKAAQSFGGAKAVEAVHNQLLVDAAANLPNWKADGDVWICKVCGNVVTKLDFQYCPICKVPVSEYEKVM
jgi:rubrerythrin